MTEGEETDCGLDEGDVFFGAEQQFDGLPAHEARGGEGGDGGGFVGGGGGLEGVLAADGGVDPAYGHWDAVYEECYTSNTNISLVITQ